MRSGHIVKDCSSKSRCQQYKSITTPFIPASTLAKNHNLIYYIPHHAIWQNADGNPTLRVVFNALRTTSLGNSVNHVVHTGPKLQSDLVSVLTRWRLHRVVFSTDIVMMYRSIDVDERDIDLQRIAWKRPGDREITHYQLLTLTYGMSCSPYLSIRVLKQLAIDQGSEYPEAARLLTENTYVDNIFAGEENRLRPSWKEFETGEPTSALGVGWDPVSDEFRFQPPKLAESDQITKRIILAGIARLYDPVGWLSPIIIIAKVLMQDLWRNQQSWDDPLPSSLTHRWLTFKNNLSHISNIRISRWIGTSQGDALENHGFGDASKTAYAAVIYICVQRQDGSRISRLLTSKTRVAPIKTLTIPRLELCAAFLVAKLLKNVIDVLAISNPVVHAWSASQNVLNWIRTADPSQWPIFVANRVAEVQRILPETPWHYVSTEENPADIASRGTDPQTLADSSLWWSGPKWLSLGDKIWTDFPSDDTILEIDIENKTQIQSTSIAHLFQTPQSLSNFSSLTRLKRAETQLSEVIPDKSDPPRLISKNRTSFNDSQL
ncbi:uncharacterized protein LOC122502219 [Leptopilina heterotoma]|uniref:uncharacterized protein LOC122502219 n=1 Tax=Leptopilina heterotoma TaxID=63436 RepID=UPI001CA86483|nr:uncharacterized protein LOC122502219 [Leptopilina heterotoma]